MITSKIDLYRMMCFGMDKVNKPGECPGIQRAVIALRQAALRAADYLNFKE
jgi:hypothetical protein